MSYTSRIIARFFSILPKGRFIRGLTALTGGAALGQAINVLISPILSRLYSPEDFCVFGVYASIVGILLVSASFRYEFAIPLPEGDKSAANILALCLIILIFMAIVSSLVIFIWGEMIVTWANVPSLGGYLWLVPLGLFGAGLYQILNYWAVRKRNFIRLGRTRFSRGFFRAIIQVGLGTVVPGPFGLLLGQCAGDSAGSISLGASALKKNQASFKSINFQAIRNLAIRYKRFPIYSGVADLIDAIGLNAPQLLFAAFYGVEVGGWFALGQRVIASPMNIVVDSFSQVFFGEAARLPKNDLSSMKQFFLKFFIRLILIGAIPMGVFCIFAPWFFTVIFGSAWETTGKYIQIMGMMFAIRFAIVPFQQILNIIERQNVYLFWNSSRLVIVVGSLSIGMMVGVSDIIAVAVYSISMSFAYVLLFFIIWRELKIIWKNQELSQSE